MNKILVIENTKSVLDAIKMILQLENYEVLEAINGKEGIEVTRKHIPDLIICDIMMPLTDGYEVLETLRQDKSTTTIPFIFLTAKASKEELRKGMVLGADDYITKPFTSEEIVQAVKSRLDKSETNKKQSEDKISSLTANISYALPHEFLTPLTIIEGCSEILQDTITEENSLLLINNIAEAAKRLEKLIQKYVTYSQAESLKNNPEKLKLIQNMCTLNPSSVLKNTVKKIAREYKRVDDLIINVTDSEVRILPENLEKIILELSENAFKFSEPATSVRINTNCIKNTYVIEIENSGKGMTPEQISNIGAYMQFERNLYEQQGQGLGLATVKCLTEIHKGHFLVESEINNYTRITIKLNLK